MPDAKLTSKGQITIPKAVRERLNLEEGDRVSFAFRADGGVDLIARNQPFERLKGLVKPNVKGVTVAAMNPASLDNHHK